MANRYWVGGTATWDNTAGSKWSATSGGSGGASAPTSTDDAFFDANSGSGTCTVAITGACQNLDCTGFTGTFAGTSAFNIYGSLKLSSGLTWSRTGSTQFRSTSTGRTIDTAGKTLANIVFNGSGGGWTLTSALSATNTIQFTAGSLSTNGYSLTSSIISTPGGAAVSISFGSSAVTLSGASAISLTSSSILSAGTSTITVTNATPTIAGGGNTFYDVVIGGSGTGAATITGANTFHTLSSTRSAAWNLKLPSGVTTTVASLAIDGVAGTLPLLTSDTAGSAATLALSGGGTITVNYLSIQDITASPAATWTAANSVDVSGNTNWTFGGFVSYTLSGAAGSYTLTGQAATFQVAHSLPGAYGAYTLTGQDATFKVAHALAGGYGSYALTGQAAAFKVAHALSGAYGSYSFSGQSATLVHGYSLIGSAGSYALTGQAAAFNVTHALDGGYGAYSFTGQPATLTYHSGTAPVAYTLAGDAGSYQFTGQDAALVYVSGEMQDTHDGWWAKQHEKAKRTKKEKQEQINAAKQVAQVIETATKAAAQPVDIAFDYENDDLEILMLML